MRADVLGNSMIYRKDKMFDRDIANIAPLFPLNPTITLHGWNSGDPILGCARNLGKGVFPCPSPFRDFGSHAFVCEDFEED